MWIPVELKPNGCWRETGLSVVYRSQIDCRVLSVTRGEPHLYGATLQWAYARVFPCACAIFTHVYMCVCILVSACVHLVYAFVVCRQRIKSNDHISRRLGRVCSLSRHWIGNPRDKPQDWRYYTVARHTDRQWDTVCTSEDDFVQNQSRSYRAMFFVYKREWTLWRTAVILQNSCAPD